MKKFGIMAWLAALTLASACNDRLDIKQDYAFDMETLPVQQTIAVNETAEIRCRLVTEGDYSENEYFIRYFQTDGEGILMDEEGTVYAPNDLYMLPERSFRLYYKSLSTGRQVLDIYIVNSFNQVVQKTFSFTNKKPEGDRDSTEIKPKQFNLLKNGYGNRLRYLSDSGVGNYRL
jgi:hypothetical protein